MTLIPRLTSAYKFFKLHPGTGRPRELGMSNNVIGSHIMIGVDPAINVHAPDRAEFFTRNCYLNCNRSSQFDPSAPRPRASWQAIQPGFRIH